MDLLTANLWILLARIEQKKQKWVNERFIYDTNSPRHGQDLLFSREYPQEVNMVDNMELGELRLAVDRLSSGIDNRMVAVATIGGALVGSLLGSLLTLLGGG